ncbi:MAG: class I SAM-dependent methyltransferase [Oscillospiraceae bacterium]|nr:class I SAM-dependent methyltransferase [Oscillospiraceae bacterium]
MNFQNLREKKLSPRLAAIAQLIRPGSIVCDVGTDHAFLPCYLARNGWQTIYATDINKNPLEIARQFIQKRGLADRITLIHSDGLLNVPQCDDIVIAGMGGETIAEIITACPFTNNNTRFILQPMTKQDILRKELLSNNFDIINEIQVSEKNKTYTILYVRYKP